MAKAKYAAGLNDFSYGASLHISHPSIDPASITDALGLPATRTTRAGQPHRSVPGRKYKFSHWSHELTTVDGQDIPAFLATLVELLSPHRSYLEQLSDDGAEIECFLFVLATRGCDQVYDHRLLGSLAALRTDLRLDLYASKNRDTSG